MSEIPELKPRFETADEIVECDKFQAQEEYLECLASFEVPLNAPDYSESSRVIGVSLTIFIVFSTLIALCLVYKKRWRQDRNEKYGLQFKRTDTKQKLSIEKVDADSLVSEELEPNSP